MSTTKKALQALFAVAFLVALFALALGENPEDIEFKLSQTKVANPYPSSTPEDPASSIGLIAPERPLHGGTIMPDWTPGEIAPEALTGTTAPEKEEYTGPANVPDGMPKSGGEDCASATVIAGLPYSDAASTTGAVDDYDEICPYDTPGSPDVVYVYTPGADITVDITLCNGSTYDTKLYVYENTCGTYQSGVFYACNDDACPDYVSEIIGLALFGGNDYYIVIDGYGGEYGDYVLDVTEFVQPEECIVECPEGATMESEPCGSDMNGGCNMGSPAWEPIACGETVCGTIWAADGTRDTDWYEVVMTAPGTMTWTCEAEFDVVIGYIFGCPDGAMDCSCIEYLDPYTTGGCNEVISVTKEATVPGTYWFFVSHQDYYDLPCDIENDYVVTLTCGEPPPPPTGRCCFGDPGAPDCEDGITYEDCYATHGDAYDWDAGELCPCPVIGDNDVCETATVVSSLPYNANGNTCDFNNDYDEVCPYTGSTAPDVVYAYTPAADICVDITLCNGSDYDTKLYVYENECQEPDDGQDPYACNDDACPGYVSEIIDLALTGGNTYYIVVDGYGTNCGNYILDITECEIVEECIVECPEGATMESEPCGSDMNGGCNMGSPTWEPIACGETVCGTIWALDGTRDTDWYEVVMTSPGSMTWTCEAEFDVVIGYITGCPDGSPDCSCITQLDPYITGGCNEVISVTYEASVPGTYWFFVSHQAYDGLPCDIENDYVVTLTCGEPPTGRCCYGDPQAPDCEDGITYDDCYATHGDAYDWDAGESCPCPVALENDECADAIEIFSPETVVGSTVGAQVDCPGVLDWNAVWYKFNNTFDCANVAFDMCYVTPVYEVQCVGVVLYAACDDCPNYILYSSIEWLADCGTPSSNPIVYHDNLVGPAMYYYPVFRGDGDCNNLETDFSFYFTMEECAPAEPGDNCTAPIEVKVPTDLPYADLNQYTCGRQDYYNATCLGYYDGGEDILYEVEVTVTSTVTITMDPKGTTWTGLVIDDACPPDPVDCIAYVTGSSGDPKVIEDLILAPGTYYIMVDTWPSPTCIPDFDLTIIMGAEPGYLVVDPTSFDFGTVNEGDDGSALLNLENTGEMDLNFNVTVSYTSPTPPDIGDAYIISNDNYAPGSTMDIGFILQNASPDTEWILEATITFPTGVYVNTSTDFVGDQGHTLFWDGTTGENVTVLWDGDNIFSSEGAVATTNITFDAGLSGDVTLAYHLQGDIWGDPPHEVFGEIVLSEADPTTSWLTVNPGSGSIPGTAMAAMDLDVAWNATGLYNETYEATIIITHDGSNGPTAMVPVTMTVVNGALKAAIEPDPTYIYYQFAFDPIFHSVFVGNFNPGYGAANVATVSVEGVAGAFVAVHGTYPGFTGDVAEFTFPVASLLAGFGAPIGLVSKSFGVTGTFDDAATFDGNGKLDVYGKVGGGSPKWITPDDVVVVSGDVDASGFVDIDDVVALITYIFGGGGAPKPLLVGDTDCSANVDIDDVVYMITYIFAGGPRPCIL